MIDEKNPTPEETTATENAPVVTLPEAEAPQEAAPAEEKKKSADEIFLGEFFVFPDEDPLPVNNGRSVMPKPLQQERAERLRAEKKAKEAAAAAARAEQERIEQEQAAAAAAEAERAAAEAAAQAAAAQAAAAIAADSIEAPAAPEKAVNPGKRPAKAPVKAAARAPEVPEQKAVPEQEEAPKQAAPRKKGISRRYGQIALVSMALCVVLFILAVIGIAGKSKAGRNASQLVSAYEAYAAGDENAKATIETLAEGYEPAGVVLELISATETETEEITNTFGGETEVQEEAATDETGSSVEEDSSDDEPDLTAFADADGDSEETQAAVAEMDQDVLAAADLWDAGEYEEAKTQLDALAAEDRVEFDVSVATSGDAVLTYGAVCGMLDLYNNVYKYITYDDVVIYMPTDGLTVAGFDMTKPVYYYDTESGDKYAAYSTSAHSYVVWEGSSEDIASVTGGTKYDLLSVSTCLSIRKQLQ